MLSDCETRALTAAASAAVDWRQGVSQRPIAARDGHTDALARFGGALGVEGLPADQVISDLITHAEPGLVDFCHPRFLGWVVGASNPVGVAADWLTSAWGQNAGSAQVTTAAGAAEEVAGTWIKSLLGLPEEAGFGFTTGATMATAIAIAAARNALLRREGWDVEEDGMFGAPEVHVVLGNEAHSTVFTGLRLTGFGAGRVHRVAADEDGRMWADDLAKLLETLTGPVLIIAQAGHINSGAIDPLDEIAALARRKNAWVHVDGAFGLWARAAKDLAPLAAGAEHCDSWAVDGHKWLQTPYDSGFVFVRDQGALERAMSVTASYLPDTDCREPMNTTPELSRRARGFAVWAVLKSLGRRGISDLISGHCAMARAIGAALQAEPGLRVLNKVVLNQVTLCCDVPGDQDENDHLTRALLDRLQAGNICYPSDAVWKGRLIIRMSLCSGAAAADDAQTIIAGVQNAWQEVREQHG